MCAKQSHFLKNLHYLYKILPERVDGGYVVYAGQMEQQIKGFEVLNFRRAGRVIFPAGRSQ